MKASRHQPTESSPPVHPRIPVAAPVLDGREIEYVLECMSTTWISSAGKYIGAFENAFAEFCGAKHAIATNNGTTALHLALVALGVQQDDEVIIPSLTYIASANTVRYCNATPIFVDNDAATFNMDPKNVSAKISPRTKGIMPVHLYGHPVDLDPIYDLAKEHGLFVLEDAAEAVGARYKERRIGGHGSCATFSFFGNKIITTGEGGMVTTDDDELAARLRLFRGQGMDPQRRYWFPVIGYNYRITNIAAAIGLAQLERVDHHLQKRKDIASGYAKRLASLSDRIVLPVTETWAEHAFWMYTIMLRDCVRKSRDEVMRELDTMGIETRPVFHPLHTLPPYFSVGTGHYPNAELCGSRGINLPTHGRLTENDMDRIVEALAISTRPS
jgi:perosamine synthetase